MVVYLGNPLTKSFRDHIGFLTMSSIFYDEENRRLVYVSKSANQNYWDEHWANALAKSLRKPPRNRFYVGLTKKYLDPGSVVLEGGCGKGDKVLAMAKAGFKAIGVDFAERTVKEINNTYPDVDVRLGDVRALKLTDASIDGYWSLGVIEHFYDGYDEIISEMHRVLKVGGYLFVTFPSISAFRSAQIQRNHYESWKENLADNFYQFAFQDDSVLNKIEGYGFELVEIKYTGNLKGLKAHSRFASLASILTRLPGSISSGISRLLDLILKNRFSHMTLIVFRKV